jgi:hypothetical protein
MPKKEKRFDIVQVHRSWQATCATCLESSPPLSTRSKASKWCQRHSIAEVDFDPISYAESVVEYLDD